MKVRNLSQSSFPANHLVLCNFMTLERQNLPQITNKTSILFLTFKIIFHFFGGNFPSCEFRRPSKLGPNRLFLLLLTSLMILINCICPAIIPSEACDCYSQKAWGYNTITSWDRGGPNSRLASFG